MTIAIMLNGEQKELERTMTVQELIDHLAIRSPAIAIEVNLEIVKKTAYASHPINQGDRVEIVTFVGGG